MTRPRIIYIIGFMGSGKTTAGKKISSALGWSFIDLDKVIEEHTGKTIAEIFEQYGEDHFRTVEATLLRTLDLQTDSVVSTGGGTPCYRENMNFMLESGVTIYLRLTPSQLKSRLSESNGDRPLIKGLNQHNLQSFIEDRLRERESWYNMSVLTVDGINLNINMLISALQPMLKS